MLGCVEGLLNNGSEFLLGEPSSNSHWIRYTHLRENIIGKSMNSPPPTSYGLIITTCITIPLLSEKKSYNLKLFSEFK